MVPEVSHRAPSAPEEFDHAAEDGIDIYIGRRVMAVGQALQVRLVKGWLGRAIEVNGIQTMPMGGRG